MGHQSHMLEKVRRNLASIASRAAFRSVLDTLSYENLVAFNYDFERRVSTQGTRILASTYRDSDSTVWK